MLDIVMPIVVNVLAVFGGICFLFIIWMVIDEHRNPTPYPWHTDVDIRQQQSVKSHQDEAFEYLDNEVRGQMRYENSISRGREVLKEPTLKGRVDAIEEHLGVSVVVKPSTPARLSVEKKRRNK